MESLLSTTKKLNTISWKINIFILIISIILIAFVNVDIGFISIIILGILNVIYFIMSIIVFLKHKNNKGLILSIVNLISVALAYYVGVVLLLEGLY